MGGLFGVASKKDCILELFYGVDYHSHLGTRRGGMAAHGKEGFCRYLWKKERMSIRRRRLQKRFTAFSASTTATEGEPSPTQSA